MTRDERLDELLGAYALDAVEPAERDEVEAYVAEHPDARAEVWEMRQAAAVLAQRGGPAPPGVWDRIVAALEERPPRLSSQLAVVGTRRPRRQVALLAAAAVLVAASAGVIAAVVGDRLIDRDETADGAIEEAYGSAWADPDGRRTQLTSTDGTLSADAVVGTDGVGFLSAGRLPELPVSETYQLWGVYDDGDVISLGVVGGRPEIEPFAAEGPIDALVITREVAGGVTASTSGALLVGELE